MEIKYFPSRNCTTVFRIAEESLGIPSLLDPCDMAECDSPDRLSILTYLSEFYHTFKTEKSPPVSKKKEDTVSPEDKIGSSDLKRKDSCDSGVSVSPLGSVCNSPPPSKKENPSEPPGPPPSSPPSSPPHHLPSPPPPPSPACALQSVVSPSPPPESSPSLDNLLRQRLNISISSPQSKLGLTPDSCEKERRNLLKSMISVSGSDITRNTAAGQETSRVPDPKPGRADRRRSLDPSFLTERTRVFQPSESASQSASRFVSCTRISLTPSNPVVKYAWNNSVTCDVKNGPSHSPLRPWRESNSCKNSAVSVPLAPPAAPAVPGAAPGGGVGQGHARTVQVKVNPQQDSQNASFKSKMMKFERMMSSGAGGSRDESGMSGSEERRRVNLTCNQENNQFPSAVQQRQRDLRRKSISFPPSFTVSLGSSEDSKLTF